MAVACAGAGIGAMVFIVAETVAKAETRVVAVAVTGNRGRS